MGPQSRSGGDWIADLMSLHIAWQQAMEAHEDEETRFRNGGSSNGACNVALHRSIGKRQALQNLIWECWPQIKAALLAASENRAPVEWHPVSELPPRPGQYLCRLPHQFIVCSYEHSPVDGKYHWNYASVDWWAELPEVPK